MTRPRRGPYRISGRGRGLYTGAAYLRLELNFGRILTPAAYIQGRLVPRRLR